MSLYLISEEQATSLYNYLKQKPYVEVKDLVGFLLALPKAKVVDEPEGREEKE